MGNAPAPERPVRIGISGAGFVARMTFAALSRTPEFAVTGVLTRRPIDRSTQHFPEHLLTNSKEALAERADIVFECSGDTLHAAEVLLTAGEAGARLVTLCAEAQVTVGSALLHRGFFLTEAHGDQPGALAALHRYAREMFFEPLAYVNFKGFYDPDPSLESMTYWAERQKTTVRAVTSYTDGTKLQIEQVLVANGLGARIAQQGMIGGDVADLADLDYLADAARALGAPISDYIVHSAVKGVLLLAASEVADLDPDFSVFRLVRTRKGRAYRLLQPHYFVYAEVAKTLREVAAGHPPLLTNSLHPTATIAALAKKPLPAGTPIDTALGGFLLRGEAVEIAEAPDALPITLLDGARLLRALEPGDIVRDADVEVPDSLALRLWRETVNRRQTPSDTVQGRHPPQGS
jgi:predicted homoserine dehydrogenase-like protein